MGHWLIGNKCDRTWRQMTLDGGQRLTAVRKTKRAVNVVFFKSFMQSAVGACSLNIHWPEHLSTLSLSPLLCPFPWQTPTNAHIAKAGMSSPRHPAISGPLIKDVLWSGYHFPLFHVRVTRSHCQRSGKIVVNVTVTSAVAGAQSRCSFTWQSSKSYSLMRDNKKNTHFII